MKRLLVCLLLLLPALAVAKDWKVNATTSTLGFSGSYQGDPFHGTFKHFDARIRFDPADLATAAFDVTVDLTSVDTQSAERDQTLAGSDFFDSANTPKAHFVSTRFEKDAAGNILAHGTLSLHGIDKPVTLKVNFTPQGNAAQLTVTASLKRLDWALGTGEDWVDISPLIEVSSRLELAAP